MMYNALTFMLLLSLGTALVIIRESTLLPPKNKNLFSLTIGCVALAIAAEWLGVQLSGNSLGNGIFLVISKYLDYTVTPLCAILVAINFMKPEAHKFSFGLVIGNALFQLVSIPFGLVFYVDETFHYHHGPLYIAYLLVVAIALIILIASFTSFGNKYQKNNRLSLILIMVIMVLGTVLQAIDGEMRVTNLALTIVALMLIIHYLSFIKQDIDNTLDQTFSQSTLRQRIIDSLSTSFIATYFIDFPNNKFVSLDKDSTFHTPDCAEAQEAGLEHLGHIAYVCANEYRDQVFHFINPDTLQERLKTHTAISCDFMSNEGKWLRITFSVINRGENNLPESLLMSLSDIDEEKKQEEELRTISTTDSLTGLFNQRAYFEQLLHMSGKAIPENFAIAILDVNGLKEINDTLGHYAGDILLKGAGECVLMAFSEYGLCYRLGGDEFAVILECTKEEFAEAEQKFRTLCANWSKPPIEKVEVAVGVAFHRDNPESSLDQLSKFADLSMYTDKRNYYRTSGRDRRRS
ncbi:MAG: diguanylate cyclase domain-containing protein [Anaerotardibacter sp.]